MRFPGMLLLGAILLAATACESKGHVVEYTPRDPGLRGAPVYWYPARGAAARAFVLFYGNDVAFWAPHQDLAWRLSGDGFAVAGVDLRRWLATLPSREPQRDSAVLAELPRLTARIRHELGADSLPIVLAGHSFGAETAFWQAWHAPPPRLVGILALNPRSSGHLYITPADWLNKEASGRWSWSTVDAAAHIAPAVRIAIVRGTRDPFAKHDSAFAQAGGARLRLFPVPLASHTLRKLLIAAPIVDRAAEWAVSGRS